MLMVDPFNVQKAMWLQGGSLYFSEDFGVLSGTDWVPAAVNGSDWPKAAADTLSTGRWKTAITPSGINVEALTFGSILSGSNLILNAGCELVTFTSALDGSKLWDLTTDWDDVLGGTNINLDVSTGDLRLTTV
jgi:hypothetical protein